MPSASLPIRFLSGIASFMFAASACAAPDRATDWRLIEANWPKLSANIQNFARNKSNRSDLDLYYLELWTYDLMRATVSERKTPIRNALLRLYASMLDNLVTVSNYNYYYDPRSRNARISQHPLPRTARLWLNSHQIEDVLNSSQFLFLLAASTRDLLQSRELDNEARGFVNRAVPVIQEHLIRWIKEDKVFQVAGWGCGEGLYDHRKFLEMKLARAFGSSTRLSYCNMVADDDLWIIATTAELIAYQPKLDESLRLNDDDYRDFLEYLHLAVELLRSRTTSKVFPREDGSVVHGLVFDAGAADDHPDSRFSGYSAEACPTADNQGSHDVGWDVSHGSRQPVVFTSLFETKSATGINWPDETVLAGFGRAFAYGVFEGNLDRPRLRNYLDGANGWYRVEERTCTGHRPFGMSMALVYGAWGRYTPFAPEVGPIIDAAHRIVISKDPVDMAFRRDVWDKARYVNGRLTNEDIAASSVSVWTLPLLSTYAIGRRN